MRTVNLCFILWGHPLCSVGEAETNSKTFLEFAGARNFAGNSSFGEWLAAFWWMVPLDRAFQTCWTCVLSAPSGLDFKITCSLLGATALTSCSLLALVLKSRSDETLRQLNLLHTLLQSVCLWRAGPESPGCGKPACMSAFPVSEWVAWWDCCLENSSAMLQKVTVNGSHKYILHN